MKTIGERIAQKREAAGLNQSELGRRMGVTPQAVQKWESAISTPRNSKLSELAAILGTSISFLLEGDRESDQPTTATHMLGTIETWDEETPLAEDEVAVPFLREIELAAGSGRFSIHQDDGETLRFSKKKLRENNVQFSQARCVTVRGNSMSPVLRDGATVGVDIGKTSISDIIDGDLYAVSQHGQLRVKQLYRLPAGIRLRSFNRDEHQDEDYTFESMHNEQMQILGHVFWWAMYAK